MRALILVLSLSWLIACSEAPAPQPPASPPVTAAAEVDAAWQGGFMATVANPYATDAAVQMLARGGHAVDAAIAAHAVLGLVEPESSGIGGGGFMVVYEQDGGNVRFLDGREVAPAGASADMFMTDNGPMGFLEAWQSGRSVGVPGAIALYEYAHNAYGRLPWSTLFEPAIQLASEGFEVPAKLADMLPRMAQITRLDENPGAADYFFPSGEPLQAGQIVTNQEYANTLQRIADEGAVAFYSGEIAAAMVAAAQAEPLGGSLTLEDIAAYQVREREAVCGPWRDLQICSATPPSSGAMQIMIANLYDHLLGSETSMEQRIAAFVDAQRMAYADRDHYFGDPDFVSIPLGELLDPRYLAHRAANPPAPSDEPQHGDPVQVLGGDSLVNWAADTTLEAAGTTHFSIIDAEGNAVSMTMTVEAPFGSARWASGFLLNNELTDFAFDYDPAGVELANQIRPGARPRSSMSPTVVLEPDNSLRLVTGSPGGNSIPAYTAKTLLGILDWGLTVQEAVDFPNIIARGDTVRVETGREPGQQLADQLRAAGYNVQESEGENSGLHVILVTEDGLVGAADPRREGNVVSGSL